MRLDSGVPFTPAQGLVQRGRCARLGGLRSHATLLHPLSQQRAQPHCFPRALASPLLPSQGGYCFPEKEGSASVRVLLSIFVFGHLHVDSLIPS